MMNHAVRKVDVKTSYSGDKRPAAKAHLKQPHGIQFSPGGDLVHRQFKLHDALRPDVRQYPLRSTSPGPSLVPREFLHWLTRSRTPTATSTTTPR